MLILFDVPVTYLEQNSSISFRRHGLSVFPNKKEVCAPFYAHGAVEEVTTHLLWCSLANCSSILLCTLNFNEMESVYFAYCGSSASERLCTDSLTSFVLQPLHLSTTPFKG